MTRALILNDDLLESFLSHDSTMNIVEHEILLFSGGESHIKIKDIETLQNTEDIVFVTKLRNAQDITDLAVAVDAFNHLYTGAKPHLFISYLPGSRQDRVCARGEAISASVYANLINSITDWSSIQFIDAHSDVMPALIDQAIPRDNILFVRHALRHIDLSEGVIVSPDAGANKKIHDIMKVLNYHYPDSFDMVRADKHRDTTTGHVIETTVYADDLSGKDCVIIDDICDGGRTFIELAKVLKSKGAANVILLVTHGIFSKGYDVVLEHVDQIVTTNSFADLSDDNDGSISIIGLNSNYYTFN